MIQPPRNWPKSFQNLKVFGCYARTLDHANERLVIRLLNSVRTDQMYEGQRTGGGGSLVGQTSIGNRYECGDGSLGLLLSNLGGSVFLKRAEFVRAGVSGSAISRSVAITVEMRRTAAWASFTASSPTASARSARNSIHKTTVERDELTSWQARSTRAALLSRG
jgi:hypothetical protein